MSETNSITDPSIEDEFPADDDSHTDSYARAHADYYLEESSVHYGENIHVDPASQNKQHAVRINPATNKRARVEFFPTLTTPNSRIKNAVSGAFQASDTRAFRVGTKDEDLFFSVIIATGEFGQTPPTLFYDNPEQYERHFFVKLSRDLKTRWSTKRDNALRKRHTDALTKLDGGGVIVVK